MASDGEGTDRCSTLGGRGVLTVDQAARILRISKMHVYRLVRSGVLAHTRVADNTIAIPAGAVRALLASQGRGLNTPRSR
jgi:excisionase family DNA binding protein